MAWNVGFQLKSTYPDIGFPRATYLMFEYVRMIHRDVCSELCRCTLDRWNLRPLGMWTINCGKWLDIQIYTYQLEQDFSLNRKYMYWPMWACLHVCVYSLYVQILDVSVVGVCSSCCDMAGAGVMEGSFQRVQGTRRWCLCSTTC